MILGQWRVDDYLLDHEGGNPRHLLPLGNSRHSGTGPLERLFDGETRRLDLLEQFLHEDAVLAVTILDDRVGRSRVDDERALVADDRRQAARSFGAEAALPRIS